MNKNGIELGTNESKIPNFTHIRRSIKDMIYERDHLPDSDLFYPSELWKDANKYLDFIFDLSDEHLQNIRLHTGFITGVPWFNHAHQPYRFYKDDLQKKQIPMIDRFVKMTLDVPKQYWVDEPVSNHILESIGIRYKNRLISDDLIRFQRCISNLYYCGVLKHLDSLNEGAVICEIGGGYGGLAHQLSSCLLKKKTYIIIDLPEILFWSAVYLSVNNPGKKFLIYTLDFFDNQFIDDYLEYDFIFIPNYKIDYLKKLKKIDLMLNLLSFQEMTTEQIDKYAKTIKAVLKGYIYTENFSRHWMNTELTMAVHEILQKYFNLFPDPIVYNDILPNANNEKYKKDLWALFPFLGTCKGDALPIRFIQNRFITPFGDKKFE